MTRAALLPGLALALAVCAAGAQAGPEDEPWVFVVHDGVTPEDQRNYTLMGNYEPWEAPVDHPSDFYDWIAEHSRAYDTAKGCFGAPLKPATMTLSEATFDFAFDWMVGRGYGEDVLYPRPRGKRVQSIMGFTRELEGMANYLTCQDKGFFSVSKTGPLSANRIEVGPAANALVERMPTFHLSAAHELAHLVQNNTAPGARSPNADHRRAANARWITEGAADAIGVLHARDHHGGKSYFGPYSDRFYRRFFLARAYNVPLNQPHKAQSEADYGSSGTAQDRLLESIENSALKNLDYQTNGFWFHVIERYLDGDPKGLHPLYRSMTGAAVARNATGLVDRWLDSVDGKLDGLEHVYPQFLAEYASWPAHRFEGRMPDHRWLKLGFGGCHEIEIRPGAGSAAATLPLAEYAGACIRLRVNPADALLRPDIQLRVTGQNDAVDDIYLGWAAGADFKDAPQSRDCYEHVERSGRRGGSAPCLLTPRDGISGGRYQRYFYLPEIVQAGPREPTEFLLVATWVPGEIRDARRDFRIEEIEITASIDSGGVSTGAGDKTPATTDYASKKGRAPVDAEGETAPGEATLRDVFTGDVARMPDLPAGMAQAVDRRIEGSVTVAAEAEGARGAQVTFFFEEPLEIGHEGPLKVFAASANGARTGVQNPDEDSRLVIEAYTGETLRFRGVAQVCEGGMAALMGAGKGAELCRIFPPRRYEVSGAIAFPTARNTEARLRRPPESEAYRNYQDIRLTRLENRLGLPGAITGEEGPDATSGAGGGTQMGIGRERVAPAVPGCDCGCASPDRDSGDLECKLLCGRAWKQCDAP